MAVFDVHVALCGDVVEGRRWWRRGRGPLKGPTTPWVLAHGFSASSGVDDVPHQQELADTEDEGEG